MDEEQRNGLSIESADGTVDNFGDARQSRKVEILEVEDEYARVRRFQSIFEKLNSSSPSSHVPTRHGPGMPSFQFDFGERKTWAVEPPSELLSRVQAFLPQMEVSNAILTERAEADPQSVDMEQVEDDAEPYIEMNLGLGVFDMKPKAQSGNQDTEMTDSSSSASSSSSSLTSSSSDSSDSDSDSDSDLDSEEILSSSIPSGLLSRSPRYASSSFDSIGSSDSDGRMQRVRMIRPLPKRSGSSASGPRPSIIVLSDTPNDDSSME